MARAVYYRVIPLVLPILRSQPSFKTFGWRKIGLIGCMLPIDRHHAPSAAEKRHP